MPRKMECKKKPSVSTPLSVSNPSASIPLSYLPQDIIVSILKRLPVKSIIRFKCVCKEWLSLLSSSKFISIHREETSNNPLSHSFIIHSADYYYNRNEMSLLNVNYPEREPLSFFNGKLEPMDFVGSVNGLVCLTPLFQCNRITKHIILWNPAMNLYKPISFRIPYEDSLEISVGFAFDSMNDDYKIIRIDKLKSSTEAFSRAEVYSATLDSWKRVKIDIPFDFMENKCDVIANGIPYWTGHIYEANNQSKPTEVLVYYDIRNGSFKHLPALPLWHSAKYVEWKGNLGSLVYSVDFVDIWLYDEIGVSWNEISSHGPIGFDRWRSMPCSRDGVILAMTPERKLVLYDTVTNRIKEFSFLGAREYFFEAATYTESLVTIKGMEEVTELVKENIHELQEKMGSTLFLKGAGRSRGSSSFSGHACV